MRRGGHGKQVGNHDLIEANERMVNLPCPLRRPMPINKVAGCCLPIPIPLDSLPKLGDAAVERTLLFIRPVKILAGREESLHQKRGFDQVSAVVKRAEYWHRLAGIAVHVM